MHTETTEPTGAETILPASFAQQRMWFLERIEGGAAYNVPVATRLHGPLDVDALEQALGALIERHESLRTVFTVRDGIPHQLIRPPYPFSLEVVDVSGAPDAERQALEIAWEDARAGFDLAADPPFRVLLVRIADDDHVLALTLHHIVTDAWSMGVLNRELGELYAGFLAREPAELPELRIQYADYAVWQQQWIDSGGLDQQLEYWRGHLAGAPPLLELPTDHPRPFRQSFRGATKRVMLPLQLLEQARALGDDRGATMFMTLLAAFAALLSRYSGQDDVVVASPVANRSRTELEGVIGLFVNTLPLRVDLDGDPSFDDLLGRVREVALGAFSNQDLPFEKLVERLAPERQLGHAPVAQVMFVVQNIVERPPTFAGLEQERVLSERGTAKFDLTFFASETRDGLRLSLEYCTDLFEEETATRMLDHYRVLLEAAVADPKRPISELRLLTESEEQRVLREWNATDRVFPADRIRPVHELWAEQARRTPATTAVALAGDELTYAELDGRANQLARHLRGLGVGPGAVVAICAERSLEQMVAVLGVLKAGGAYAPIDPNYPPERVEFMLADTAAPVVLTEHHLLTTLPAHTALTVCLDVDRDEIAALDDGPVDSGATLDDLAYVIYTSGSTGRPKGVAMGHRALANLLAWQGESTRHSARALQFASLSFDVAFQELFSTWCSGGTLVLVDDERRRDPEALLEFLREERVERLFLPFVALHNLCEAAGYLDAALPALREVITAGEQLKVTEAVRGFFLRHPRCTLVNQYGPTESHVVTAHALADAPIDWPSLPPIGRPIANAKTHILDRHLQPVPVGIPGELWLGGVGLARGYLGRPDLTAERFVADPFSSDPEARLYRTGDRARYRPDGEIEFLGRADHQVKIRGFRIEPGEVENALRNHPAVREALVVARQDDDGDKRLVGYVLVDEPPPTPDELHDFVARTLPDYMIPSAFETLDAFPLTPNGKIDRAALPAPGGYARGNADHVPPETDDEKAVAALWQGLLKVDQVGSHDNFFALGGHSLLATQLISRVRDALALELPLRTVFEEPTVAGFARAVEAARNGDVQQPGLLPIHEAAREWRRVERAGAVADECVLPASFAEQRLWFLDRLEPDNAAYNLTVAKRLHGPLDVAALERALGELVARHESLRTTFSLIDDVPQRVIRRLQPIQLPLTDLTEIEGNEERAQALVGAEARRGYDLETGPLFRPSLLRLAAEEHIFILTLHHIVVDGWSMGVLNRELGKLYGAFASGTEVEFPSLPVQVGDYAAWQQQWIASGGLDEQIAYWKDQLSGAPALLELPTDRPRPARQSHRGAVVRGLLPPEVVDRLKTIGEREGATLFMTLLAAFSTLLSRYSAQDDVVVASPVANRERSELEGLIGFFVNTLPLRVDLEGDPSFRALVARVRESALGAFSNQDIPFEKLVEELNPERHLSYSPIAQVLFVLQAAVGESSLELPGLTLEPVRGARLTTKFDVSLHAVESPDGLRLSFEYATDIFDEATLTRMLAHYMLLLEAAASDPDRHVTELELFDASERERLLDQFAGNREVFPVGCLHELFERRAASTPTAPAVSYEGEVLSYGELNARANRLAHLLADRGVGPETLVALCLERSLDLVVSILAVLKAGGAYVPLDPDYPAERLAFALEDTAAPVLLSQERVLPRLPAHQAHVICLDRDAALTEQQPDRNPEPTATPDNAAYVIYTSGSTGRPKGVTVEHRNVARLLSATDHWFGFGPDDGWLLLHSYAFDFSVWELWGALLYGGRLIVVPQATTRTPALLRDLIVAEQVTVLNATPSLFLAALDDLLTAEALPIRVVVFGGEALQPAALRPWFDRFGDGGPRLVNMYGITETTVHVTYRQLSTADVTREVSPIGEPIPDLQVYVLDSRLEPVPEGVPGEIYVGGAGVARGYLNRPELTADRFRQNPYGTGTLYRSGDRARHLNGQLLYLGRADDQVKIRGFRIELGEIESALRSHADVGDVLVLPRRDAGGDTRLVAYLTSETTAPSIPDLRDLLAHSLPRYMIPSAFVVLDAFPLTSNGKLDRAALVSLPLTEPGSRRQLTPPRTETEKRLAAIWQRLLEVDELGVDDDFFELGGHSLLAVRLASEIERRLGVRLPLSALFETATVAGLAHLIEAERREETDWSSVVRLQRGNGQSPLFLVAWAGGEVLPYRDLVESLDSDLPVFGLRAPGVDRRTPPLSSVEQLAAHYVEQVRQVQPHGPYRLGGFCFSGVVAYEMAAQLQAQGEPVSTLALIHAYPYRAPRRRRALALAELKSLKGANRAGRREWLRARVAGAHSRGHRAVYLTVGPRAYEFLAKRNLQRLFPRRPWNPVLIASNLASSKYVPKPLDVRVQFFHAQQTAEPRPTPWDGLATGGVDIHQIVSPGIDHDSMIHEPHVQILAEQLMGDLNADPAA